MRMRKKPNLIPRMERCAALQIQTPQKQKGKWLELLSGAEELHLELGCGKGRFTVETAAQNPGVLFVAVERVPDAMVIAMERAAALKLGNVFFLDADASYLADYFAPGEVKQMYINFCDPWPSNRHMKRRLTSVEFLERYRQVLGENGQIHFKTDNALLFNWSLTQFPQAGFSLSEVTHCLHEHKICGVMTDYEEKFHNQGISIHRCVATMGPRSAAQVSPTGGHSDNLRRYHICFRLKTV